MFKYQWGLLNKESGLDINILPLWNYIKKTNVGIGIADTGINYNHCCLKNYVNPYLAYDFVVNRKEDSKGYCEYDDHGTSVAGIIAAIPLNDYGICGITENSCITSLKIFGENNSSKIKSSDAFVKACLLYTSFFVWSYCDFVYVEMVCFFHTNVRSCYICNFCNYNRKI